MIAARASGAWVAVAIAAALLALHTREVSTAAVLVPLAAGTAGLLFPFPPAPRMSLVASASVAAVGMAAFATPAVVWNAPVPRVSAAGVVASVVAAIGEEAFFRRGIYGWLARFGPAAAVGGSALAFALVHVPMYGWAAGAVDLAAGAVFGWQRWATGRWSVPAATHVFANLVASV